MRARFTATSNPEQLTQILRSVFGFARFRASQEEVCRTAIAGRDLRASRSAAGCRPLRGGGAALIVSPLIALMQDQAAKLSAFGLPNQLLAIDGIGPAKPEKFGEAILSPYGAAQSTTR